jgi:hypothetical protein
MKGSHDLYAWKPESVLLIFRFPALSAIPDVEGGRVRRGYSVVDSVVLSANSSIIHNLDINNESSMSRHLVCSRGEEQKVLNGSLFAQIMQSAFPLQVAEGPAVTVPAWISTAHLHGHLMPPMRTPKAPGQKGAVSGFAMIGGPNFMIQNVPLEQMIQHHSDHTSLPFTQFDQVSQAFEGSNNR